jgi:hypothetical protein
MAQWNAHKLAGPAHDGLHLVLRDRVRAKVDLEGAPVGTEGTVMLTGGFNWLRYRVLFDNGVEHGFLDERHIERASKRFGRRR